MNTPIAKAWAELLPQLPRPLSPEGIAVDLAVLGDARPSEAALMERWGVSRRRVRTAIDVDLQARRLARVVEDLDRRPAPASKVVAADVADRVAADVATFIAAGGDPARPLPPGPDLAGQQLEALVDWLREQQRDAGDDADDLRSPGVVERIYIAARTTRIVDVPRSVITRQFVHLAIEKIVASR